jgi:DNA phosphorothioation system restriction enzyme
VLRDLRIADSYRSDVDDLLQDFFLPCLRESVSYDRAAGFFTSTSLALAAQGVTALIRNGGRMRLVASPRLTDEDAEAIASGYRRREDVIEAVLERELVESSGLERERVGFLAWLIATRRLDVKIAIVERDRSIGIYHEKVGIFRDASADFVVFSGSANESASALIANFESFEVFRSWEPDDVRRAERRVIEFDALWSDTTPSLRVFDFPEAAKRRLLEYAPSEEPDEAIEDWLAGPVREAARGKRLTIPRDIELRSYQKDAVQSWFSNNGRGIWRMATGSGKTIAALTAAAELARLLEARGRSTVIVVTCPLQHLVRQWAREAKRFGARPIECFGSRERWGPEVDDAARALSVGASGLVMLITTNDTFTGSAFQDRLAGLNADLMLVADEVHTLGALKARRALSERVDYRLGLSATPERWYDDEGTSALSSYFGPVVFEFGLAQAIAAGALTPYRYFPVMVELSPEELDEYLELTAKIGALVGAEGSELATDLSEGPLQALLIRRSRLLGGASGKVPALRGVIAPLARASHHLVYCADTSSDDGNGQRVRQLDSVMQLLGHDLRMSANSYTHETSPVEREILEQRFTTGELQALVAIRCLDEGIDIPEARSGFILASTSNPRQFIQRRGRLLRRSPGKQRADVYDFIVVPPGAPRDATQFAVERRLLRRELARVVEFATLATNGPEALAELLELRRSYHLLDIG